MRGPERRFYSRLDGLRLNRRHLIKWGTAGAGLTLFSLLTACGGDDDDDSAQAEVPAAGDTTTTSDESAPETDGTSGATQAESGETQEAEGAAEGEFGGTGKVALYSEPPTLDSTWTTAIIVLVPSQHVFEYLTAFDSEWDVQPFLVDGFEVSDDGLGYTFNLRQGIKFHNGKEMTAADIVASINRWGELSGEGQSAFEAVTEITAADDYTVDLTLSEPFAPLLPYLAGPNGAGAIIMPQEIAEAAGTERLDEYIGTGPYKFVEHIPARHIKVTRFEDYSPRSEPADAYAGKRTAYFDELLFIPVPDAAARIAGVEAGDYHYAIEVTRDEYERLQGVDQVEPLVIKPLRFKGVVFNKEQGPMADPKLRKAAQYAFDHQEMMAAGFGPQDFWRLHPSLMPPESLWYTEKGAEFYNPHDLEMAKQLVEESDYDGEPVRWMGPSDREDYFGIALTGVQHLKDIGINAELVSMDWGTLTERRTKPDQYEIFNTGLSFNPEPTTLSFIPDDWPGWWVSDKKDELLSKLFEETEFDPRYATWEEFQMLVYEEVPIVRVGDFFGLDIKRTALKGEKLPISSFPIFWNSWIAAE